MLRGLLQSEHGDFPLGLWVNGNPIDLALSAAFEILATEVLGLQVFTDPRRTRFALEGFFALAGCLSNQSNWDCSGSANRASKLHVMLGVYLTDNEQALQEVQRLRVGGILDIVGTVGFSFQEALHYSHTWNANNTHVGLEYFRTYNAQSRPSTAQHFSNIQDVNSSGRLLPCADWGIYSPHGLWSYLNLTGDVDGMVADSTSVRLRCMDSNWWFAPACRSNPQECIPTVTCSSWGYVWYVEEIVWKATAWNMPLAVAAGAGCGTDGDLAEIARRYNVLFYFWAPDAMLSELEPVALIFPKHERRAWQAADFSTTRDSTPLMALMNQDVNLWAPQVRMFVNQMKWDMDDINSLLASLGTAALSWNQTLAGACQWLKDNRDVWQDWIPHATTCLAGQGLYSAVEDRFVNHRANAATCRACSPGWHSESVMGDDIATAICVPCEAGRSQASHGSVSCDPCLPGTVMPHTGAMLCEKCLQGEYQELEGQAQCLPCHEAETTKILGATHHSDCECQVNHFWQSSSQRCEPCKEGLLCQGGHALPLQKEGFWADVHTDISDGHLDFYVYRCRPESRCPAGELGGCRELTMGRACGSCQSGFSSAADGTCNSCEGIVWPWVLGLLVVLTVGCLPLLQSRCRAFGSSRAAASLLVVGVMIGQGVTCIQALEAIRQLEIAWIEPLESWLSFLSLLSFDLEIIGLSCYVSSQVGSMYLCALLSFPIFVFSTWVVFRLGSAVASQIWQSGSTPDTGNLWNIHLLLLVSLYTGLSLMVFMPFECRGNPAGIATLVLHPQVICGDYDHNMLLLLAVVGVLVYPLAIFAALVRITWKYPTWLSSSKGIETLQQFRIIFGKFKPERFYYCLLITGSNLVIAIIPVVLLPLPVIQVSAMCCVLWLKQVALCFLWPWKDEIANWTDLLLSGGLLLLLNLAAPLMNLSHQTHSLGILMVVVAVSLPVVLCCGAIFYLACRLLNSGSYAAFLSHHKGSSGVLCRHLKLVMKKVNPRANVFYDADNLVDLTDLFQIIQSDVKCMVVVLSPGLFGSPWCTGEICTAFAGDVPIVVVAADGYTAPDYDEVNMIVSNWPDLHRHTLVNYGFDEEIVKTAFAYLHRVQVFDLSRSQSLETQESTALKVATAAFRLPEQVASPPSPTSGRGVCVLVCGGSPATSHEAVSACLILQMQLQVRLRVPTIFIQKAPEVTAAGGAACLVVVLTKGLLEDPDFGGIIMAKPNLKRLVLSDGTFAFPRAYFKRIADSPPSGCQEQADIDDFVVTAAFQSLCMHIALLWTPQGSEGLMIQQLNQICHRIGDVESTMLTDAGESPKSDRIGLEHSFASSRSTPGDRGLVRDGREDRPPELMEKPPFRGKDTAEDAEREEMVSVRF